MFLSSRITSVVVAFFSGCACSGSIWLWGLMVVVLMANNVSS